MFKKNLIAGLIGALLLGGSLAADVVASEATLVVVPARYRMIQLAFDLAALRDTAVVSYRWERKATPPEFYRWAGTEWVALPVDAYAKMAAGPVIIVGIDVPPAVLAVSAATAKPLVLATFDMAELVNQIDKVLRFTPAEWKWLAARYDLVLTDSNAERRHYGRYGSPAGKQQAESDLVIKEADVVLPPVSKDELVPVPLPPPAPEVPKASVVEEPKTPAPEAK